MAPRTILYLTPSSRLLGARRSLLQLVTHLDPARYRPVVAVQSEGDLVVALEAAGVPVRRQFLGWWRKGRYMPLRPLRVWQLARLARRESAALLHCNEFYPTPYAVRAAAHVQGLQAGRPHHNGRAPVQTDRDCGAGVSPAGCGAGVSPANSHTLGLAVVAHMRLSIAPRQIEQYDLRRAARILCVSEAAARDFDVWPDRAQRVEVVYNGVDLDEFAPRISREEARRRLDFAKSSAMSGTDSDSRADSDFAVGEGSGSGSDAGAGPGPDDLFVVGQFGLLSPRKRPHLLIEAAALARPRLPGLRLLIVGSAGRSDGPYEARLHALVAERGLADIVRFVPFTPDVVDLYTACDANALISNDEGFGRTIIEAAVQGIPSIGARVGGIPELIEEGRTGLLLPAEVGAATQVRGGAATLLQGAAAEQADGDPHALADALVALGTDPARRAELGRAARALVAERFSIARHAEHVMAIYDRLLDMESATGRKARS
jgi:glycosyltransferase involved in cell wall biosynthesis